MKQNELLIIVISIFVLSAIWIVANLYHAYTTSTVTADQNAQIVPIDPHFNTAIIQTLKTRTKVDPLFQAAPQVVQASPSATPTVSHIPLKVTPSKTASSSSAGTILP